MPRAHFLAFRDYTERGSAVQSRAYQLMDIAFRGVDPHKRGLFAGHPTWPTWPGTTRRTSSASGLPSRTSGPSRGQTEKHCWMRPGVWILGSGPGAACTSASPWATWVGVRAAEGPQERPTSSGSSTKACSPGRSAAGAAKTAEGWPLERREMAFLDGQGSRSRRSRLPLPGISTPWRTGWALEEPILHLLFFFRRFGESGSAAYLECESHVGQEVTRSNR
jgi:hypothetical protein